MRINWTRIFVLLFVVINVSCSEKECDCTTEIFTVWEAVGFISLESMSYGKDDNYSPVIEFKENGKIDVRLDANTCFGNFELFDEGGLEIGTVGCTKICCDSDFSVKFTEMLPQVTSYSIDGKTMKLNIPDWGWIALVEITADRSN